MTSLFAFDRPDLDDTAIATILSTHWGISGGLIALPGERSNNSLVTTAANERFVLQIQSRNEVATAVELQTDAMMHLERVAPHLPVSRVIPTLDGESLAHATIDGDVHLVRLVTYLPGETFDPAEALPNHAYLAIGALLGEIGAALATFDHRVPDHFMPWDIGNGLLVNPMLRVHISDESERALGVVDRRLTSIAETIPKLRQQTIHNDGHAGNLLRADGDSPMVTGVIDFGDITRTAIAADVAIAAESFAPDHAQPGEVTALLAAGYHRHHPLTDADVSALPELVLARLALSVLLVEVQIRESPHLADRSKRALPFVIERLERWAALDPDEIAGQVRDELGSA
ncbi:MAG TPA: phosphotransferase [Ilumatobacter sp.]|nr:phosphotransferase [Ilumatobacter sp.]